jgi:hypothetical protein
VVLKLDLVEGCCDKCDVASCKNEFVGVTKM